MNESIISNQMIVRLDEPRGCYPHGTSTQRVSGWFLLPLAITNETAISLSSVNVMLQQGQLSETASFMTLSGVRLKDRQNTIYPSLRSLAVGKESRTIFDDRQIPVGKQFSFEGEIDISPLLEGDLPQTFSLVVEVVVGEFFGISNVSQIEIASKSQLEQPIGGFLSPDVSEIRSDYLLLEGWGLSASGALQEVEFFVNDVSLGKAECRLLLAESQIFFRNLVDGDKARFSLLLSRSQIKSDDQRSFILERAHSFQARCKFDSGAELLLESPKLLWLPPLEDSLTESGPGEIEEIKRTPDGLLTIAGWLYAKPGEQPRLLLESLRHMVEPGDEESPGSCAWLRRADLESRFCFQFTHRPYGFELKIDPFAFGRYPGQVKVLALTSDSDKPVKIGSESDWNSITERLQQFFAARSLSERLMGEATGVLSKRGIKLSKKEIPSPRASVNSSLRESQRASSNRLLVGMSNLSDVEGAPKVLCEVLLALKREQENTDVLVLSQRGGGYLDKLEAAGIECRISSTRKGALQWERVPQEEVERAFSEFQPTLVVANVVDSVWLIDEARRRRIPSVWSIHESINPSQLPLPASIRLALLHQLAVADQVVFVSEETRRLFSPFVSSSSSRVVTNGIDIDAIAQAKSEVSKADARKALGVRKHEKVISIVGTTVHRKGQDIFIRAIAELREQLSRRESLRAFIVGAREIPYLDELRSLVSELDLGGIVTFVPETPEVEKYFLASDALVIASRAESAPLVSLEAFAYEVPVVSTTVFGLAEQIRDGENALAFESEDYSSLSRQLERILTDSKLSSKLTKNAYEQVVERHSLSRMIDEYKRVFEQLSGLEGKKIAQNGG